MATELGVAYVSILPSMDGFSKSLGPGFAKAEKVAEDSGKKAGGGFGDGLKTVGLLAAAAAGAAIGAAASAAIVSALDIEKGNDKLAAQLGLTAKESESAGKIAGSLYAGAYGESMGEVQGAVGAVMSSIEGMRTASSSDVEATTAKVLDMASAFEIDVSRAAQVAGQMITSGLSDDPNEAIDLLVGNLQKVPAAVREDLLDAVDEYGPFFSNLGIEGADAMGILTAAAEDGMYGIDKTGDAIKEFQIRSTDMSKATRTAYENLGLDHDVMVEKLLAGGPAAQEAMGEIVGALQTTEDPAQRAADALALFGTPLEDLSVTEIPEFLGLIDPMGDAFDTMAGKADEMGATLNDNASTKIESFKRTLETNVVNFFGDEVIPAIEDFWAKAQPVFKWIGDNAHIWGPFAAGVGLVVGGFVAWSVAAWAVAGALAVITSPITLVVGGLALLAGAVLYAYNNIGWFKDGVDTAFGFISDVIGNVVEWFTGTAVPWFTGAISVLGDFFTALWRDWIKPAFDMVSAGVEFLWSVIQTVFTAIGGVFTWLWKSIIKPVFDGIWWAIDAWWQVTSALFGIGIAFIRDKLGAVFTWLYENIISPVFTWISDFIAAAWGRWQVVFQAVSDFLRTTLGPVFTWLYENIIKPVWDNISRTISDIWNNNIKPIFDRIGEVVRAIPSAFEAARDGIASAWNALVDIAKKPVIFVVDTVIGGLIDTFNKIPGVNITKPKLPASFYAQPSGPVQRGRTRAFAKGGFAAPGWALVGEEGPELVNFSKPGRVYTADETAHALGSPMPGSEPHIWGPPQKAAARAGSMKFHGLGAFPMNMLSRAAAAWNGLSGVSANALKHVAGWGANSIGVRHGAMLNPNWIGYYQGQGVAIKPGGPNELATLVHEIGHALGLGHNTGNTSVMNPYLGGGGGALWPTSYDAQNLRRIYGSKGSTRDSSDGGAPDNPFTGLVDTLMGAFKKAFPGGGMFIDAAGGLARSGIESVVKIVTDIQQGIKDLAGTIWGNIKDFFGGGSGQTADLHDQGGWLNTGRSVIQNNTRKPEAILNHQQWQDISKLALQAPSGREIVINGNVGWDPAEVAREIERSERRQRITEGVLV